MLDTCGFTKIALTIPDRLLNTKTPFIGVPNLCPWSRCSDSRTQAWWDQLSGCVMEQVEEADGSPVRDLQVCVPDPLADRLREATTSPSRGAKQIATTDPTSRDHLWTYLSSNSVLELRKFGKDLHVGQKVPKKILVQRIFSCVIRNGDVGFAWDEPHIEDFASPSLKEGFKSWMLSNQDRRKWMSPPKVVSPPVEMTNARGSERVFFSVEEYARLMLILSKDDNCRAALLQSVQERSRSQLDQREARDSFWFDKVAPTFNDGEKNFHFSFSGELRGIVPGRKEGVERKGEELKKHYMGIRSIFTVAYDKWSRSGQNCADNFADFCDVNSR